jgi:hypothetical protein
MYIVPYFITQQKQGESANKKRGSLLFAPTNWIWCGFNKHFWMEQGRSYVVCVGGGGDTGGSGGVGG